MKRENTIDKTLKEIDGFYERNPELNVLPMPQPKPERMNEKVLEEFEKICGSFFEQYKANYTKKVIESFILQSLSDQRETFLNQPANEHDQEVRNQLIEEIVREVEKMKKNLESGYITRDVYIELEVKNQAYDEVINIIQGITMNEKEIPRELKISIRDYWYSLNTVGLIESKRVELEHLIRKSLSDQRKEICEAVEKMIEKPVGGDSFYVEIRIIRNTTLREVLSIIKK